MLSSHFLFPLFAVLLGFFKIYFASSNSALNATILYKPIKHLVYFSPWGMLLLLRLWNMVTVMWLASVLMWQYSTKLEDFSKTNQHRIGWLSQASSMSCENQQWRSLPSPTKHIFIGLSKGRSKLRSHYLREKKVYCREGRCKPGCWNGGLSQGKSRLPKPMWGLSLKAQFLGEEQLPLALPTCMVYASRELLLLLLLILLLGQAELSFQWNHLTSRDSKNKPLFPPFFFFSPLSPLPINQRRKDQMYKTTKW